MKVYPINEDALEALATASRDFSLNLALSSGFAGVALNAGIGLIMALAAERIFHLPVFLIFLFSAAGAAIFSAIAVAKRRERVTKLSQIKERVEFVEE